MTIVLSLLVGLLIALVLSLASEVSRAHGRLDAQGLALNEAHERLNKHAGILGRVLKGHINQSEHIGRISDAVIKVADISGLGGEARKN